MRRFLPVADLIGFLGLLFVLALSVAVPAEAQHGYTVSVGVPSYITVGPSGNFGGHGYSVTTGIPSYVGVTTPNGAPPPAAYTPRSGYGVNVGVPGYVGYTRPPTPSSLPPLPRSGYTIMTGTSPYLGYTRPPAPPSPTPHTGYSVGFTRPDYAPPPAPVTPQTGYSVGFTQPNRTPPTVEPTPRDGYSLGTMAPNDWTPPSRPPGPQTGYSVGITKPNYKPIPSTPYTPQHGYYVGATTPSYQPNSVPPYKPRHGYQVQTETPAYPTSAGNTLASRAGTAPGYSFQAASSGTVSVYRDGQHIADTTPEIAAHIYGYKTSDASSNAPSRAALPTTSTAASLPPIIQALTNQAYRTGQQAEQAVGALKNTLRIPSLSGTANYRVPDILDTTEGIIGEVKNVKYQALTSQIRDDIAYAQQTGMRFELWINKSTRLSGPLKQAAQDGEVLVKTIPSEAENLAGYAGEIP